MRGRILIASILAAVLTTACSRKDSLYIDTTKDGPAPAEASGPKAPKAAAESDLPRPAEDANDTTSGKP